MTIECRSCHRPEEPYALMLCKRCYFRWKKRLQRDPHNPEAFLMLNPTICKVDTCMSIAINIPGCLVMCPEHHVEHYHTHGGYFESVGCLCRLGE